MKRTITHIVLGMAVLGSCFSRVASAQLISGSGWTAETKTAPALAYYNGNVVAAWRGAGSGNHIWYSFGPSWATQQTVPQALTTDAPALTATSSALYVGWRGESTSSADHIYYTTYNGSEFAPQAQVCGGLGSCPETIAAPALASNGSTVYLAYTTTSNTIMLGSYAGSGFWSFSGTAIPGASTAVAPALAVNGGTLYLAWVEEGTSNIMYSSLPLSGGSWSAASQVAGSDWAAQTSVAPTLGVSPVPTHTGVYIAWTAPATTPGEFTTNYSEFTGLAWNGPIVIPNPPDPAPANTTPALLGYVTGSTECGFASSYYLDVAYVTTGEDIELAVLQADSIFHKCTCPCPDCCN